jgi:hypothetical protein
MLVMKMVTLSWYKLLRSQWQSTHCQIQCQELQEQEHNSAAATVPVEIVAITMAVNPLSASVSRAAGIGTKLSYSCSTCDLLLFDFHQDRNILKLKYNIFYPNTLY